MKIPTRIHVPVYGPHSVSTGPHDFTLPYSEAKALVVHGEATFINRARAIRLKSLALLPQIRGASCCMTEPVMRAHAEAQLKLRGRRVHLDRKPAIVHLVESWNPENSEVLQGAMSARPLTDTMYFPLT